MTGAATPRTSNFRLFKPAFDKRTWHDLVNANFDLLDAVLGRYIALNNIVGVWANGTSYNADEAVVDASDGSLWRANTTHVSAASGTFSADRTANPTYWRNITLAVAARGNWLTATQYYAGDFAVQGNDYIVCLVDHVSGTYATDLADGKWVVVIDGDVLIATLNALIVAADLAMQAQIVLAAAQVTAATTQANAAAASAAAAAASAAAAAAITGIPSPTVGNNGKFLGVTGGLYALQSISAPPVFVLNDQGII